MLASLVIFACIIKAGLGQMRPASHCEIQRQGPSPEWAKPKCNPDGSYHVYQCDAYTRTTCWCVYENGQMIPGTTRKVHDPEQEKRDLANCEKARKNAPPAPPPAPAPSATLDPRLGYHLATAAIPEVQDAQSSDMVHVFMSPQEVTLPSFQPQPQSCPQFCSYNCPPGCPMRIPQQMPLQQMPMPQMMPMPQPMTMPQMMPCPRPCQGAACPQGCPQIPQQMPQQMQFSPHLPVQMPTIPSLPAPQQVQQTQCPMLCMNSCPPGCPTLMQQQGRSPASYQPIMAPQMPPMQPQMPSMQPQMPSMQPQMPPMQPQMPPMQPQMPPMQPQMMQASAMPSPQGCPIPCINQCPPGCPRSFMDPTTGQMQEGVQGARVQRPQWFSKQQRYQQKIRQQKQRFLQQGKLQAKLRPKQYAAQNKNARKNANKAQRSKTIMDKQRYREAMGRFLPQKLQNVSIRRGQKNQRSFWKTW